MRRGRGQDRATDTFCDHGIDVAKEKCPFCHEAEINAMSEEDAAPYLLTAGNVMYEGFATQEQVLALGFVKRAFARYGGGLPFWVR